MLYDDLVAEFAWSPEQMSAPFDLKAADEVVRKRIESRRRSSQADGRPTGPRKPTRAPEPGAAPGPSTV